MEFGYWGIKGISEPIRWLIGYLGLDVKEYNPPSFEEWFSTKKPSLKQLDFPNLPYLIDGDFSLTESCAIPIYLINKAGKTELLGKDAKDQAIVCEIEGVLTDIRQAIWKPMMATSDQAGALTKTLESSGNISAKIEQVAKFLGEKDYLLGYLTYADFHLAYLIEFTTALTKSLGIECPWCKYKNLGEFIKRIRGLHGIKERFDSAKQVPFMPPSMLQFKLWTTADVEAHKDEKKSE